MAKIVAGPPAVDEPGHRHQQRDADQRQALEGDGVRHHCEAGWEPCGAAEVGGPSVKGHRGE